MTKFNNFITKNYKKIWYTCIGILIMAGIFIDAVLYGTYVVPMYEDDLIKYIIKCMLEGAAGIIVAGIIGYRIAKIGYRIERRKHYENSSTDLEGYLKKIKEELKEIEREAEQKQIEFEQRLARIMQKNER